jgi:hypothetical protein
MLNWKHATIGLVFAAALSATAFAQPATPPAEGAAPATPPVLRRRLKALHRQPKRRRLPRHPPLKQQANRQCRPISNRAPRRAASAF